MNPVAILIGVVFAGVGTYLAVGGARSLRLARAIRANDPLPVRELPTADEPLEFEGRVAGPPDGDLVEAPYSGREAVVSEFRIREKRGSSGGSGGGSSWHTVESGAAGRPFVVDDGSARVEVDPDDAAFEDDWETVETEGTIQLFGGTLDLTISGLGSRPTRYQERLLEPGDDVHVYGARVTDERGGWDDDVEATVGAASATDYALTEGTEADAVRSRLWSGLGTSVFGLVFGLIGVFVVLTSM